VPVVRQPEVLAQVKAGRPDPLYLLLGDDEAGKAGVIHALESLVEPDLRGFNLHRLYANEIDPVDVVAAARTVAFLGGRRVVVLLRAEVLLKPRGKAAAAGDAGEDADDVVPVEAGRDIPGPALLELERYLASPSPDTTLVLVAADLHRGTRLGRILIQHASVLEFWGLKTERDAKGRGAMAALEEAERLVRQRARQEGMAIDEEAVERILSHAGTEIGVLRGDLERVATYCAGRGRITAADVAAVVGGAVAHDDWALVRAIEHRDLRQALRQLHLVIDGGTSPFQVLGQLGWFVRSSLPRMAPARVAAAVEAVFETDFAMKTSRGDAQVLLERLVVSLCGEESGRRAGQAGSVRGFR
jgi:DNA polymerase III delta subunit